MDLDGRCCPSLNQAQIYFMALNFAIINFKIYISVLDFLFHKHAQLPAESNVSLCKS